MAISRDEAEKFVGGAWGKPGEGSELAGKGLVGGGGWIDEFVPLDTEATVLPNEHGGGVISTL